MKENLKQSTEIAMKKLREKAKKIQDQKIEHEHE